MPDLVPINLIVRLNKAAHGITGHLLMIIPLFLPILNTPHHRRKQLFGVEALCPIAPLLIFKNVEDVERVVEVTKHAESGLVYLHHLVGGFGQIGQLQAQLEGVVHLIF